MKMKQSNLLTDIPGLAELLVRADHIDVKSVTGDCSLREFIAGMFSYYPGWIKNLYRIRWGFVRLLGMKQEGIPQSAKSYGECLLFMPNSRTKSPANTV